MPTGFCLNAERQTRKDVLVVEMPSKNCCIEFERLENRNFDIRLTENGREGKHLIGKNIRTAAAKAAIDLLLLPHKDKTLQTLKKELKKLFPKKKKTNAHRAPIV